MTIHTIIYSEIEWKYILAHFSLFISLKSTHYSRHYGSRIFKKQWDSEENVKSELPGTGMHDLKLMEAVQDQRTSESCSVASCITV
jgi:hypothetical protein